MLSALQKQLDILSSDESKLFEGHLKSRWKGELPPGLIEDLREFVCMLPRIERRIYALYVWLPETSSVKSIGGHFLTYMYQPEDFIPENEKNGLFGYLDDAYMAALFYELMLEDIEKFSPEHIGKSDRELLRKAIRLRRKAKAVIPLEAIKIKEMIADLFSGDERSFNKLFKSSIPVKS